MPGKVDFEKERESILKELNYQRGFEASIEKKLSNEKFVGSAPPQVVEMERKKKADAAAKIKSLEESLKKLISVQSLRSFFVIGFRFPKAS